MELYEKIKYLRAERGLTLEDVGNYVGVGKSTVRKWECGQIANMRRDKIAKLAEVLGVTPAYLMGWEEPARENNNENKKDAPALSESVLNLIKVIEELSPENRETLAVVAKGLLQAQSESK